MDHPEWTFEYLRPLPLSALLDELVHVQEAIANLAVDIAFLRAQEGRGVKDRLPERVERDGDMVALTEKKWLVLKLIEVEMTCPPSN